VHGPDGHLVAVPQRFLSEIGRYIRHGSARTAWQGRPTGENSVRTNSRTSSIDRPHET
jgi:hypothetical protein